MTCFATFSTNTGVECAAGDAARFARFARFARANTRVKREIGVRFITSRVVGIT